MKGMNLMKKKLVRIALGTILILSIPMLAMRFSNEWNWDETDFLVAGMLLFGTGSVYELVSSKVDRKYRVVVGILLLVLLLLVWAELAVGIF